MQRHTTLKAAILTLLTFALWGAVFLMSPTRPSLASDLAGNSSHEVSEEVVEQVFAQAPKVLRRTANHAVEVATHSLPHLLSSMRQECASHLPVLKTVNWRSRTTLWTRLFYQRYFFSSDVVCYSSNGRWFHDHEANRSMKVAGNNNLNEDAVLLPMTNGSFMGSVRSASFAFHRSFAVVGSGAFGMVNMYHNLVDLLMGMSSAVLSHPEIIALPRDAVMMHYNRISRKRSSDTRICASCIEANSIISDDIWQPSLTIGANGAVDGGTHCFCGMALVHRITQSTRLKHGVIRDPNPTEVLSWVQQRLAAKYFLKNYSSTVEANDFHKYSMWTSDHSNATALRLVFVTRKHSRFVGNQDDILDAAKKLGFEVHVMSFDGNVPLERQLAAVRYTDVLMGIHGAALATSIMISTNASSCQPIVVELMHWAAVTRLPHIQILTNMLNVTLYRAYAIHVKFGKSVKNPLQEKRALKNGNYNFKSLGFNDQTAYFPLDEVNRLLKLAKAKLCRCELKRCTGTVEG
jgi:hypothetical protein